MITSLKKLLNLSIFAFNGAIFLPVEFSKPSLIAVIIFSEEIKPETIFSLIAIASFAAETAFPSEDFFVTYREPTYMSMNIFSLVPAPFKVKFCPSTESLASTLTSPIVFCAETKTAVSAINNVKICFFIVVGFIII